MRNRLAGYYLLSFMLIAVGLLIYESLHKETGDGAIELIEASPEYTKLAKRDRIDLAMAQEFEMTRDPALGYVPRERLVKAREIMKERMARPSSEKTAIAGVEWVEMGPNNVGGRTRAILIDPNDATGKTVFAASVAGGLWKTTDISKTNPDWTPVDEFLDNLAITCIAADPSNSDVLYVGTGEGWFNIDYIQGDGIFRSADGGSSWSQLLATASNTTFRFVQKVVVDASGNIYAATRDGGVQRSTDSGSNWSTVLSSGGSGSSSARCADIEIAANGTIYAAMGIFSTDGVYSSATGDLSSWTKLNTGSNGFPTTGFERIEIACAPSDATVIYALTQDDDGVAPGIFNIYKSTDSGANWSTTSEPTPADPGQSEFTRSQAWYNLIAAVDPNDADRVIVGGIDLYLSSNGGTSWTQISDWRGSDNGYQYVHADQHALVYRSGDSDTLLIGNDGGVYLSTDASAGTPTIDSRNDGYNVTQLYGAAMHPTAGETHFLSGSQDNGSHRYSSLGLADVVEVTGGDGGIPHIDQDASSFQWTTGTYTTFYRSTDGGLSFDLVTSLGSIGRFINPSDYDDTNDNYYAAYSAGTYLRWTDPQSGTTFSSVAISAFNSQIVTAVTVSPNTANRVFFGTPEGRVVRVDNAASSASGTHINSGAAMPSGTISCIAVEDGDDDHLLVTYSNYGVTSIYETTDGGSNWTAVEGNLPDMPVRWALFSPDDSDQALIATELGVWSTDDLDGGSTDWDATNTGLANVRVDMLQIRSSDKLVIAATHGRGMYSTNVFNTAVAAEFTADKTVGYINNTFQFTDLSTGGSTYSWTFGDGNTSTDQHPTHQYNTAGQYTVSLTINGSGDTETKTTYIHVLPNRGTPYEAADGGDFESNAGDFASMSLAGGIDLWERGTPTNAITTLNSSSNGWKTDLDADIVEADYSCALYSPSFNMTVGGTYTLRFRKSMEVQFSNAPFGVQVEFSTDQGASWQRLGTDTDGSGTNWYERGPGSGTTHSVVPGGYAFCSNFTNQNTEYDVSSLSGNSSVCFRIVFHVGGGYSASGYTRDGFMVDDFELSGETNDAALPVHLISFSANVNHEASGIELNWETAAEINNSHWLVERRDASGDYQIIGQLEGQGTTTTYTAYTLTDYRVLDGIKYQYRLLDIDYNGQITEHPPLSITYQQSSETLAESFLLGQNYPNPFNPRTAIPYRLAKEDRVQLTIFNLHGQEIATLVDRKQGVGEYVVTWDAKRDDGSPVSSGIYLYRLTVGDRQMSKQMIYLQ